MHRSSTPLPWSYPEGQEIRRIIRVACITDKVREARLRWYGHIQRREEDDCVKRILEADVHGQRSRGRQRKRWTDVIKYNMEDLWLTVEDTGNRAEWRRRTHVADPLPEGFTAWRRERESSTPLPNHTCLYWWWRHVYVNSLFTLLYGCSL